MPVRCIVIDREPDDALIIRRKEILELKFNLIKYRLSEHSLSILESLER